MAEHAMRFLLGVRDLVHGSERNRRALADALGIGLSELLALGHLYTGGPMTAGRLAELMGLTTGSTTALIDRAQRAGYLTRQVNPQDRRSVLVALTPAGSHAMAWTYEQTDARLSAALRGIDPAELDRVSAVVQRVADTLLDSEPTFAEPQVAAPVSPGPSVARSTSAR